MAKLRLAHPNAPHIRALLDGTYRFVEEKEAKDVLHYLKSEFVTSRHKLPEPLEKPYIILWIRNFSVTEEEKALHYAGHYALVTVERLPDQSYTLHATKLPTELKVHPTRLRPKADHPNWHHPFLRHIAKGGHYASVDEVQTHYQQLGAEYPKAVIPCTNKCYAMIYDQNCQPPVQKYVLTTLANENGSFRVEVQENKKPPSPSKTSKAPDTMGKFTAQVALGKKPGPLEE